MIIVSAIGDMVIHITRPLQAKLVHNIPEPALGKLTCSSLIKMINFSQTAFFTLFSWNENCWISMLITLDAELSYNSFINSLWPDDAIWWHRSGSTLAQVMACCLTTPSHYLNQCWLIISKVQWHSLECNFTRDISAISHWNWLENYLSKILVKSSRGQWVNILSQDAVKREVLEETGLEVEPTTLISVEALQTTWYRFTMTGTVTGLYKYF